MQLGSHNLVSWDSPFTREEESGQLGIKTRILCCRVSGQAVTRKSWYLCVVRWTIQYYVTYNTVHAAQWLACMHSMRYIDARNFQENVAYTHKIAMVSWPGASLRGIIQAQSWETKYTKSTWATCMWESAVSPLLSAAETFLHKGSGLVVQTKGVPRSGSYLVWQARPLAAMARQTSLYLHVAAYFQ